MIAQAVTQGSPAGRGLSGTRTGFPPRGGSAGSNGGLAPGEFGLVSLIVSSSSVGCDIPAWP
jgi:hypothetical protein